jgi:hypothetical protein
MALDTKQLQIDIQEMVRQRLFAEAKDITGRVSGFSELFQNAGMTLTEDNVIDLRTQAAQVASDLNALVDAQVMLQKGKLPGITA